MESGRARKEQGPEGVGVEAAARFANATADFNTTRPGADGGVLDWGRLPA